MKIHKISIIVPCFNEENYIGSTLKAILEAKLGGIRKEIIVVDDGSTDASASEIKNSKLNITNMEVIRHGKNMGKGAAIRSGFKKVTGDVVIIQDADNEYNPNQYKLLLNPFIRNNAKVVYGSRTLGIEKFGNKYSSLFYYFGGRILTWYMNILFNTNLTDQPSGYKVIRSDIIPILLTKLHQNDFSAEIEMTAALAKHHIPIVEIPIVYMPRSVAEGKKIKFTDFIKALVVGLKCRFT